MRNTDRKPVDNPIVGRIEELLKVRGKTQKEFIETTGLSNSSFTRWKYDNGKTYMNHLPEICDFLGVSPNYILYGIDEEISSDSLSAVEIELIRNYRHLDVRRQNLVTEMVKCL